MSKLLLCVVRMVMMTVTVMMVMMVLYVSAPGDVATRKGVCDPWIRKADDRRPDATAPVPYTAQRAQVCPMLQKRLAAHLCGHAQTGLVN